MAAQKQPKGSTLEIFGPTMSATPQFGVKIRPNQSKCGQYLEPDEARKCKIPLSSHKVLRMVRAKAKKTPMCSVSLIAIKLKGLAAPGEALKIIYSFPAAILSSLTYQLLHEALATAAH